MHSPETLAHTINLPFYKDKWGHKKPIISIWHHDPEKDGTDDSCGWFMRDRHMPAGVIDKIEKEFESEWDRTYKGENGHVYNCGWFNPEGENILSVRAIVLNMYIYAAKIVFDTTGKSDPGKMWKKAWKFVNKNYAEIMYFAENNRDSMRDAIVRKFEIGCKEPYTEKSRKYMIRHCASIIACDIARKTRPWYKHPRWHIHHWSLQIHPLQNLKRRWWDKCCICGKRGFKGAAMSDWNGTKRWHQECDNTSKPVANEPK